jgi:hypothetical protein
LYAHFGLASGRNHDSLVEAVFSGDLARGDSLAANPIGLERRLVIGAFGEAKSRGGGKLLHRLLAVRRNSCDAQPES